MAFNINQLKTFRNSVLICMSQALGTYFLQEEHRTPINPALHGAASSMLTSFAFGALLDLRRNQARVDSAIPVILGTISTSLLSIFLHFGADLSVPVSFILAGLILATAAQRQISQIVNVEEDNQARPD